ncbi:MAG: polysaccharide deacetylase family protein [Calditrichia bacterium]
MKNDLPLCSFSLDLDNLWTYLKTHGNPVWQDYPTYLPKVVPIILDTLAEQGLTVTFFMVGKDWENPDNRPHLKALAAAGHQLGNHTYHHDPWLHLLERDEIEREIRQTGEIISGLQGKPPIGFRGPGFSWSAALLEVLAENGYLYDGSSLPTFLAPLARAYFLKKSNFTAEERRKRKKLFGGFADGFRPIKPYLLPGKNGTLLEIPVTTMPFFKVPFHFSYLLYLAGYSEMVMKWYLEMALLLCRWQGVEPSFLLHPLDFIGPEDAPGLQFFPGMGMSGERKRHLFQNVVHQIRRRFQIVSLDEFFMKISNKQPFRKIVGERQFD